MGIATGYLLQRAEHAAAMPACYACFTATPPAAGYRRRVARPVTVLVTSAFIAGAVVLVDPAIARAAVTALFTSEPNRPTISVAAALFPETIPGYNQELGVNLPTVSLAGPAAEGLGIHTGPAFILPTLDVQPGYDSNVLGVRHGPGSATLRTAPAISFDDAGSRARVGAFVGIDNTQYFQTPNQSRTDVTAALGVTAAVGRGVATLAYSHLALHDDPAAIGAIPSSTPTPFAVDDLRASFDLATGRAALRPFLDVSHWSYGQSDIGGVPVDQSYRDRDVLQAGIAGRFNLGERRDLLATVFGGAQRLCARPGGPGGAEFDRSAGAGRGGLRTRRQFAVPRAGRAAVAQLRQRQLPAAAGAGRAGGGHPGRRGGRRL